MPALQVRERAGGGARLPAPRLPLEDVRGLPTPLLLGRGAALRRAALSGPGWSPAPWREPRPGRASPRAPSLHDLRSHLRPGARAAAERVGPGPLWTPGLSGTARFGVVDPPVPKPASPTTITAHACSRLQAHSPPWCRLRSGPGDPSSRRRARGFGREPPATPRRSLTAPGLGRQEAPARARRYAAAAKDRHVPAEPLTHVHPHSHPNKTRRSWEHARSPPRSHPSFSKW